jgi:uncharacterized RDD family membrane protein YckC
MSQNKVKSEKTDWQFSVPVANEVKIERTEEKVSAKPIKKSGHSLKLDHSKVVPSMTRSELYEKLKKEEDALNKDVINYGPIYKRALASILDYSIYGGVYFLVIENKDLYVNFLNQNILFGILIFIFIYFPVRFYNGTIGKLVLGLRVRGEGQYTLSTFQVLLREIVLKPVGLISIIDWAFILFNKEQKSIHDYISKTLVVINN